MASRLCRLSRTDARSHGLSAGERVERCKDTPFHLTHRILRQPGDDSDHLGNLEVSKTFATEDPQAFGFGLRLQHDRGIDLLAVFRVRHSEARRLSYCGVSKQHGVDLHWRFLLA